MPSELQSLDTIFNNRVFRIPDYQRGYAWQSRPQLTDFWEDLDGLDERRKHYTGQLTLEAVPEQSWKRWDEDTWLITGKGYKPFYIVDGQQRLATALILIKCILDRVSETGSIALTEKTDLVKRYLRQIQPGGISRAYLFGYEKDNPSYEFFKTKILDEPSNQYTGIETTYTANLLAARTYFTERLKHASAKQLGRWFKAVTQQFVFNVYELEEELDVFVVFETMNNRGKPLSYLELLKNRLIYLSTLLPSATTRQDRETLRRNVNDAWKTIFEFLGREKDCPLDDDDFLKAHWIMYFTYAREEGAQFASFLLGKHFTTQRVLNGDLTIGEIQNYVTSIQDSVQKWHAINFPDRRNDLVASVRERLERLTRLDRGAFGPMIMAAMQTKASETQLTKLLDAAEQFIFTVSVLCHVKSNTGDSHFYRSAGRLFRKEESISEVVQSISEWTERHFGAKKARDQMEELFAHDGDGFYAWNGRHYLLFEYEQYLKQEFGMTSSKVDWHEFTSSKKDHETIEHIYPVTPVSGDWPEFEGKTRRERQMLRNSLGNLLALSHPRNSKLSNRKFALKKKDYANGSYSEIAVSKQPAWTPQSILDCGLEILNFVEKRWKVSLGTRAEKIELLSLRFLEPGADGSAQSAAAT